MKEDAYKHLFRERFYTGPFGTTAADGNNGMFHIKYKGETLRVVASDGLDWPMEGPPWEHVSVSCENRTPTWDEMDFIKRTFWNDDETVIQFHVPREDHVNIAENCLHLWRCPSVEQIRPPTMTVGPKL